MPRYVKCRHCNETELYQDRNEKMDYIEAVSSSGKVKKEYCHKGKCFEKYKSHKEFIQKEESEKDELNTVIKDIYNIKYQIPPMIWELIQDLRNGTNRYTKLFKKRYKKGIPYSVLCEAFKMSRDSIHWARLNRRFKTLENEMVYGMKIVQGKIEDANKKLTRSKQAEEFSSAREELNAIVDEGYSSEERIKERENKQKYKSKNHIDMSNFLDD